MASRALELALSLQADLKGDTTMCDMVWLDGLVATCTAFRTWDEFAAAMLGGYVPTIWQDSRRKRLLTAFLCAEGWNVFDGRRVR